MADSSTTPVPEPTDAITLEEWIASTQSCCGVEPERAEPSPTIPVPINVPSPSD